MNSKKGVTMDKAAQSLKTVGVFVSVLTLLLVAVQVLGDTAEYNLTFSNATELNLTVNITQNATYIISITNNNDSNRSYNLSVDFGSINESQINLTGGNSTNVSVDVWNASNMTIFSIIFATLADNGSVILNSSEDMGQIKTTILDNIGPSISNVSNYSVTNQSAIISWNADEAVNGTIYYGTSSGNRSLNTSNSSFLTFSQIYLTDLLASTMYFYIVNISDASGNQNESPEYNFSTLATPTNDTAAPIVFLNDPIDAYNSTSNTVYFNCSVVDETNLTNVTLYGNWSIGWHAEVSNTSGINNTDYIFNVTLGDGTYIWNCYACDNSSNCAFNDTNRTFSIDTSYPIISNVSNSSITNQSAVISWNSDQSANASLNYGINDTLSGGSNASSALGTFFTFDLYNLANNTMYYYNVTSCDYVGNCNTSGPYNFTTLNNSENDSTNPTVQMNSPIDSYNSSNLTVEFNCFAVDGRNLTNVTLYGNWSGGWHANTTNSSGVNNSNYTFALTLVDGTYVWNCYACDNSSNCAFNNTNRTMRLDSTSPTMNITYPLNATNVSSGTTWTWINLTTAENAECRYNLTNATFAYADGVVMNSTDNLMHFYNFTNGSALIDGTNYTIYYLCNDTLGNVNSNSLKHIFFVNETPGNPAITTVIVSDNITRNNTEVIITVNVSKGTSDLLYVSANGYNLSNQSEKSAENGIWNGTINLTTGGSPISVVAIDTISLNDTNNSVTFAIDDISPQITFNSPVASANISATNYSFVYTITDSYFLNGTYSHNGTVNGTLSASSGTINLNLTSGLSQTLNLTVLDEAGNTNTSTLSFSMDNVSPSSSADYSNASWKNYSIVVNISATDPGIATGVKKQYYCVGQDTFNCTNFTEGNQTTISVDGNNTLRYFAQDFAGNNGTEQNLSILIDKTLPVYEIFPIDEYNTSSLSLNISWNLTESHLLIANWSLNNTHAQDITVNDSNLSSVTVGLDQSVTFYACDEALNCISKHRDFHVDVVPPNVSDDWGITDWVNNTNMVINLTAVDNAQGVGVRAIRWCAQPNNPDCLINNNIPGNSTTVTGAEISVDGNYTLRYYAVDYAGLSTAPIQLTNILIDRTSPILTLSSPVNNVNLSTQNLSFTWTTTDANFLNLSFSINGTQRSNLSENGSYTETNVSAGLSQTLSFHVLDQAGNGNTTTITFNIDWLAPNTTADYSNNTNYVNHTVLINYSENDYSGVGVENYYSCIGNGPGNDSCTPSTVGNYTNVTGQGVNYIRYYSVDFAGNNESSEYLNNSARTLVAYIDLSGPTITSDYTSIWRKVPFNVTLTSTDVYSGPNRTYHLLQGSSLVQTDFSSNQTLNTTVININQSGNWSLLFYGYDNVANRASNQTIYVLFDNQSPNATINALPTRTHSLTFNITYNATDYNLSGVDRVYVFYKNANSIESNFSLLDSGTSSHILLTVPAEGNYTFYVKAQDNVGINQTPDTTRNTTTLVDATNPSLNITAPENGVTVTVNYTNVTWEVADTYFANVTLKLDDGAYFSNTSSGYHTFINLSAGFHKIYVKATDLATNSVEKNVNITVALPFNMTDYLLNLDQQNIDAYGFYVYDSSNYSINYTNSSDLNLTNTTVDLTFIVNVSNTTNSTPVSVVIEDFAASAPTYSVYFNATSNNSNLNSSIYVGGYNPQILLSIYNFSEFITNDSAYYANVTFNITNIEFDYVHHCTTNNLDSCTFISNCTGNNFTGVGDLSCYTIDGTDWMSVYVDSFSSVVLTLDNIMAQINITSPDNATNITSGSNVYLNFSVGEVVRGNYSFDGQPNVTIDPTQSYSNRLNGTLNSTHQILANGVHNITLNLWDNSSYNDSIILYFNVSDYYVPTITSITVTDNTTSSATGSAIITVLTNEYTRCWYAQNDSTLVAAVSDLSGYSQTSLGAFSTIHTITHSFTSSGTEDPYYVTCQDALGNNMSTNSNSGTFTTTYNYVAPPPGGGGGGGSRTTPPADTTGLLIPSYWGLYNDLFWQTLMPDVPEQRNVRVNRIAIRNVTLSSVLQSNQVLVRVAEVLSLPPEIPVVKHAWDNQPVYQYMELTKANISENVLTKITLGFEVSKFWINNNDANVSEIKLYRYSDLRWQELPTRIESENDEFVYYESDAPGFNFFAVVSTSTLEQEDENMLDVEVVPSNESNESTPEVDMFNETTTEPETTDGNGDSQTKKKPNYLWTYIVISVITFLVIMYVVLYKYYKWKHRYF